MGRNMVQTNLLQCRSCGHVFEASPDLFTKSDHLVKSQEFCQKCIHQNYLLQKKQIGDQFQSILMYCKNRKKGCTMELPSSELASHENNCDYRPVRCIWYLQCEEKEISFCDYRKHLEQRHQPYIKKVHLNEEHKVVLKMLKDQVKVSSVVCDEKKQLYFIRKCCIDLQKDLFMVCVHYIGKREDAKKFICKVKIHQGLESLHTFYEYNAYCSPCIESPNASDAHPNCFVLHPKKLFLTNDFLSELKYSVTIKRVKEPHDS